MHFRLQNIRNENLRCFKRIRTTNMYHKRSTDQLSFDSMSKEIALKL